MLFIDEYDLIKAYNDTVVSEYVYHDAVSELEQYGLIYFDQFSNMDTRAIYVKVFSKEEENKIIEKLQKFS